jgi:hypothetical protein
MSLLRRIEKSLDQRLRSIFSGGENEPGAREAIELYRDALEQIASRATLGKRGDRVFPFNLIRIELRAGNSERKAILETLFDAGQLGDDIRAALKAERIMPPPGLTIEVHYQEEAAVEMRVICERAEKPAVVPVAPAPVRLITLAGVSSEPDFALDTMRINLGREEVVLDALGRAIRRNELFFKEDAHEANATVSRSHAHIGFDALSGEWRIYDDGSSLGTTLFRAGRRIDVPAHASRGVALRAEDEIYLGQVRLRFQPDEPPR